MAAEGHVHMYDARRFGKKLVFVCLWRGCRARIKGLSAP